MRSVKFDLVFLLALSFLVGCMFMPRVWAYQVSGIEILDKVQRIGDPNVLSLKSASVKRSLFVDKYIMAFYAGEQNVSQRIMIQILADKISYQQLQSDWRRQLQRYNNSDDLRDQLNKIQKFLSFFDNDLKKNDIVLIDYFPKTGTQVAINGKLYPVIAGLDFFELLANSIEEIKN